MDKPVAALIKDLKSKGLLDETLVLWGGEFGRMPMSEQGKGRDHNPWGYSVWLAGSRVRAGPRARPTGGSDIVHGSGALAKEDSRTETDFDAAGAASSPSPGSWNRTGQSQLALVPN